jgi:RNA-directed DNA polymerase
MPVVIDRCLQAMVKNALEPAWEARFEGISYGFRPGRSCHDAIGKIYGLARPNKTKKWVLDADIRGAYDNISHDYLLKAIGPVPGRELIRQWLKAGYVEQEMFHATERGTPQGGVASPLLANIALHGMEEAIGVTYDSRGQLIGRRAVVRYADDFVCFCESREDAEQVQRILMEWLKERGLILSEEKTRIVHLTEGFDFLGFNIRHYPAPQTSRTGWKLLIKPSKESVQEVQKKLKDQWHKARGTNVQSVLAKLNPIIRGWANYHRHAVSSKAFSSVDATIYQAIRRWVNRRHRGKAEAWKTKKYFTTIQGDNWVFFGTVEEHTRYLIRASGVPIVRHVKIQGEANPYDPAWESYFEKRLDVHMAATLKGKHWLHTLWKEQAGLCPICTQKITKITGWHSHHLLWRSRGGSDAAENRVLLHPTCHQQVHSQGIAVTKPRPLDNRRR